MSMHTNQKRGTTVHISDHGLTLWASKRATANWANKPGAIWPCSTLAGRRLKVEFDRNGICDMSLNGRYADSGAPVDASELNAFVWDMVSDVLPEEHPARDVLIPV